MTDCFDCDDLTDLIGELPPFTPEELEFWEHLYLTDCVKADELEVDEIDPADVSELEGAVLPDGDDLKDLI